MKKTIGLLLLFVAPALFAQTFSDNTFPNSFWQDIVLPTSAAGAKCTSYQDGSNGTPAPSRFTEHVYPPGWIDCAHIFTQAIYDPASQGEILALGYSFNAIHYTSKLGGVRYTPLIVQNSTYFFFSPGPSVTSDEWTPFSGTLHETDFVKLSGPWERKNPDFSCKGPRMQFGYLTRNHLPSGPDITTKSAIDNWAINLETRECAVVPRCPPPQVETTIDGQTYCCDRALTPPAAGEVCCRRTCPPGSHETTVNGVTFCCRDTANGVCCTPR
jgi:hypothetical protein